MGESTDEWILLAFAFIPARYGDVGAVIPGGEAARVWSPVTYAFLHADWVHLLVNMIWMASFGGPLARRFGAARFLLLSLVSAADRNYEGMGVFQETPSLDLARPVSKWAVRVDLAYRTTWTLERAFHLARNRSLSR